MANNTFSMEAFYNQSMGYSTENMFSRNRSLKTTGSDGDTDSAWMEVNSIEADLDYTMNTLRTLEINSNLKMRMANNIRKDFFGVKSVERWCHELSREAEEENPAASEKPADASGTDSGDKKPVDNGDASKKQGFFKKMIEGIKNFFIKLWDIIKNLFNKFIGLFKKKPEANPADEQKVNEVLKEAEKAPAKKEEEKSDIMSIPSLVQNIGYKITDYNKDNINKLGEEFKKACVVYGEIVTAYEAGLKEASNKVKDLDGTTLSKVDDRVNKLVSFTDRLPRVNEDIKVEPFRGSASSKGSKEFQKWVTEMEKSLTLTSENKGQFIQKVVGLTPISKDKKITYQDIFGNSVTAQTINNFTKGLVPNMEGNLKSMEEAIKTVDQTMTKIQNIANNGNVYRSAPEEIQNMFDVVIPIGKMLSKYVKLFAEINREVFDCGKKAADLWFKAASKSNYASVKPQIKKEKEINDAMKYKHAK